MSSLLKWDNNSGGTELSRVMSDAIVPLFKHAEGSLIRCTSFTAGFGAVGLVQALNSFNKAIIVRFGQMMTVVEAGDSQLGWDEFQVGAKILGVCSSVLKRFEGVEMSVMRYVEDDRGEGGHQCLASAEILIQSTLNSLELSKLKAKDAYLEESRLVLSGFTTRVQHYCFSSLLSTISTILATIPTLEWITTSTSTSSIPTFSNSPSTYITNIGEFLLTLPQRLDLYDGEALWTSIETLPFFEEGDSEFAHDDEYCTHLWFILHLLISIQADVCG